MRQIILIIEPRREVAAALEDVVSSVRLIPIIRPHVECLTDLAVAPAAILVRISFEGLTEPPHRALERMANRPPVLAIAWEERDIAEAARLKCEIVIRAPQEVHQLGSALTQLVARHQPRMAAGV